MRVPIVTNHINDPNKHPIKKTLYHKDKEFPINLDLVSDSLDKASTASLHFIRREYISRHSI